MTIKFQFDPERIAHFEAAGWRAYYDHKWFKMLLLLVFLCKEQFCVPLPVSLIAAYYTVRASLAWVPINHDERKVLAYLKKFYGLVRRYSGLTYDISLVAALELQYFDVHRRLAGKPEKDEFLQTLIDLHSTIFGLPAKRVRESAEWRLRAANTVDQITSHTSTDIEADWASLEEDLRRCYRSIQCELKDSTSY